MGTSSDKAQNTTPQPPPDTGPIHIGKYPVSRRLGKGGMGEVWLGHHPDLDLPVAIKTMSAALAGRDPAYVERFIKEARTAARINHENVVRIYDAGSDGEVHYIVMELVEGGTAQDLLKSRGGVLSPAEALQIVTGVAEALKAAARYGIIHRDIKPANIMLAKDGTPKLADLGLAKHSGDADDMRLTVTGMAMGTPTYMAPEQATDAKSVDARADIYSLGATLYHLATGDVPFKGDSSFTIMTKHVREPLPHPKSRKPDLPDSLSALICKMMAKSPADRHQSAEELLADLRRIQGTGAPIGKRLTVRKVDASPPPAAPAVAAAAAPVAAAVASPAPAPAPPVRRLKLKKAVPTPAGNAEEAGGAISLPTSAGRAGGGPVIAPPAASSPRPKRRRPVPILVAAAVVVLVAVALVAGRKKPAAAAKPAAPAAGASAIPAAASAGPAEAAKPSRTRTDAVWRIDERRRLVDAAGIEIVPVTITVWDPVPMRLTAEQKRQAAAQWQAAGVELVELRLSISRLDNAKLELTAPVIAVLDDSVGALASQGIRCYLGLQIMTSRKPETEPTDPVWTDPGAQAAYLDLLAAITRQYRDRREAMIGMMLITEPVPPTAEVYAELATRAIARIHAEDPRTCVLVQPPIAKATQWRISLPANAMVSGEYYDEKTLGQVLTPGSFSLLFTATYWKEARDAVFLQQKLEQCKAFELTPNLFVRGWTEVPPVSDAFRKGVLELKARRRPGTPAPAAGAPAAALPVVGQPWTVPEVGLEMVPIKDGKFMMGAEDGDPCEKPVHEVTLTKPFWMGKYEVTWQEYWRLTGQRGPPAAGQERIPCVQINWDMAVEFGRLLTEKGKAAGRLPAGYVYRLPTEAEWEYCCRAGTTGAYAGDLDALAWYAKNSGDKQKVAYQVPIDVGSKAPNAWGLHDMHGSAWEWCHDWFAADYYAKSPKTDPAGPASGSARVVRGGAVGNGASVCRSAFRRPLAPGQAGGWEGWRVVLAPEVPAPPPAVAAAAPASPPLAVATAPAAPGRRVKQRYEGVFPVGIMLMLGLDGPPDQTNPAPEQLTAWRRGLLTTLKDLGFNTVGGMPLGEEVLALAGQLGMYAVSCVSCLELLKQPGLTPEQATAALAATAAAAGRHPHVIAGHMSSSDVMPEMLDNWRVLGAAWNGLRPDMPLLAMFWTVSTWQQFDAVAPVAAAAGTCVVFREGKTTEQALAYPVCAAPTCRDARAAMPGLPVWPRMPGMAGRNSTVEPTVAEMCALYYSALAEGIRGCFYFWYQPHDPKQPMLSADETGQPGPMLRGMKPMLPKFGKMGRMLLPYEVNDNLRCEASGKAYAGVYSGQDGLARYIMLASKDVTNRQRVTIRFSAGTPAPTQLRDALDGSVISVVVKDDLATGTVDIDAADGRLLEVVRAGR